MRTIVTICMSLVPYYTFAQVNLVPNPGFESYNACPTYWGCVDYSPSYNIFTCVQDWVNPMYNSSSDYYNACTKFAVGVPTNGQGHQLARTGNAYVGIWNFLTVTVNTPPNYDYREYVACKLLDSMRQGLKYDAVFYVSFTIHGLSKTSTDQVGINFSDTAVYMSASLPQYLTMPYSIKNTLGNTLTDTAKWMKVSGTYTAHGGEQYMTIGCFKDNVTVSGGAYFYIDDVSVIQLCDTLDNINGITDITFCSPPYTDTLSVGKADTYKWSTGDITRSIVINDTGNFSCISKMGCRVIKNNFRVRAFISDTVIAVHDTVVCGHDNVNVSISSIDSGELYKWNTGDTFKTTTVNKKGTFWCNAYKNCTLYVDSFHLNIFDEYASSRIDTVVCKYDMLFLSSPRIAEEYLWNTGSLARNISIPDTGVYWCEAHSLCRLFKDTFHVIQKPFDAKPGLDANRVICEAEADHLNIGKILNPTVTQYLWNTGADTCCISVNMSGRYILTVSDGCSKIVDSIYVSFIEDCNDCIAIPTAFSPNNDNLNDKFRVVTICPFQFFVITIHGRWGENLYTSNDPKEGWNGRFRGEDMQVGTYFYMIKYKAQGSDQVYSKKGDLMLVR